MLCSGAAPLAALRGQAVSLTVVRSKGKFKKCVPGIDQIKGLRYKLRSNNANVRGSSASRRAAASGVLLLLLLTLPSRLNLLLGMGCLEVRRWGPRTSPRHQLQQCTLACLLNLHLSSDQRLNTIRASQTFHMICHLPSLLSKVQGRRCTCQFTGMWRYQHCVIAANHSLLHYQLKPGISSNKALRGCISPKVGPSRGFWVAVMSDKYCEYPSPECVL